MSKSARHASRTTRAFRAKQAAAARLKAEPGEWQWRQ